MSPETRRLSFQTFCLILAIALGWAAVLTVHMHWYQYLMILFAGILWGFWAGYVFRDQHRPPYSKDHS